MPPAASAVDLPFDANLIDSILAPIASFGATLANPLQTFIESRSAKKEAKKVYDNLFLLVTDESFKQKFIDSLVVGVSAMPNREWEPQDLNLFFSKMSNSLSFQAITECFSKQQIEQLVNPEKSLQIVKFTLINGISEQVLSLRGVIKQLARSVQLDDNVKEMRVKSEILKTFQTLDKTLTEVLRLVRKSKLQSHTFQQRFQQYATDYLLLYLRVFDVSSTSSQVDEKKTLLKLKYLIIERSRLISG